MPQEHKGLPMHTPDCTGIIMGLSYFRDITVETYPSW